MVAGSVESWWSLFFPFALAVLISLSKPRPHPLFLAVWTHFLWPSNNPITSQHTLESVSIMVVQGLWLKLALYAVPGTVWSAQGNAPCPRAFADKRCMGEMSCKGKIVYLMLQDQD